MTKPTLFLLAAFIFALDQLTKKWAVGHLPLDGSAMTLIPRVLYFTRTSNTGSAFSLFQGSAMALALVSLLVASAIVYYVVRQPQPLPSMLGMALALPLGGALGNFLDRVRLSYVVDFIFVRIGTYPWPVFNVADSAICIGIALLACVYLRQAVQPSGETLAEPSAASRE